MTAARESFVLPFLFLTVALLGGLRVAAAVRLMPPSLVSLVLGLILLGVLVRAGALAPHRLMAAHRRPLENLTGAIVLATLFAASAQVFNLLTPERGLLFAAFSVYFLAQLLTTLAGVTSRESLLRALAVLFGASFVLRFVVLESLYAADAGLLKRITTALLEGVSLGSVEYEPHAPVTGYAAFATLVLYLIGLALLPAGQEGGMQGTPRPRTRIGPAPVLLALLALLPGWGLGCARPPVPRENGSAAIPTDGRTAAIRREAALRAARVWHPPPVPVAEADLAANPAGPGGYQPSDDVACRYVPHKWSGTTPKFHCVTAQGREIKVKYGANPELHAEVAATRLLSALGFGADRMYVVRSVACTGCPAFPYVSARCEAATGLAGPCGAAPPADRVVTVRPAVIEEPLQGTAIEAGDDSGWAWFELDRIDPAAGGASRAEVDALRLMAVLLAHWDNKPANQRLLCPEGQARADGRCAAPLAMIQDAGATFGPLKLDLQNWRRAPVWAEGAACTASMASLPYRGATFAPHPITEEGRLLLAGLLHQLSDRQLTDLFTTSRVVSYDHPDAEGRDAKAWVAAFREKVLEIAGRSPCPPPAG